MKLKEFIIKHEGLSLKPYHCPAGKLTIGVGRNIEDNGISEEEAMIMLENDIQRSISDLYKVFSMETFDKFPAKTKMALIDMIFNLGYPRFIKFKKMIKALKDFDYEKASIEAVNSLWCKQVGSRCKEVSEYLKG